MRAFPERNEDQKTTVRARLSRAVAGWLAFLGYAAVSTSGDASFLPGQIFQWISWESAVATWWTIAFGVLSDRSKAYRSWLGSIALSCTYLFLTFFGTMLFDLCYACSILHECL